MATTTIGVSILSNHTAAHMSCAEGGTDVQLVFDNVKVGSVSKLRAAVAVLLGMIDAGHHVGLTK